jgi:5-methylcytosine-specific restriction protein A
MDRRTKAKVHRNEALRLKEKWGVEAVQVRYRETGNWYATLKRFPAALFDRHGYILFPTEEAYQTSPYIHIGKEIGVPKGISAIPGYRPFPISEQAEKIIENLLYPDAPAPSANDVPDGLPARVKSLVHRFIRDTKTSRQVKELYEYRCQVCGERLEILPGVFYAEAHHLQPLGGEHKGPDVKDNILCVCPNHHALFDYFAISLDPAKLLLNKHDLRKSFVDYHNGHFRNIC